MTDEKQAVVDESKAAATPAVTDDSARVDGDPLDTLLSQWDEAQKAKQAPVSPSVPHTQQQQEAPLSPRAARLEERLFQEDLNEAVSNIAGDMKIPRRAAIGWLDQIAREKPAVGQAFLNKANDPQTWERFERALRKEMKDEFKSFMVDETATADREAVAQAVRGASTTKVAAEPAPKFGGMSNAAYRKYVIENHGFDPGV